MTFDSGGDAMEYNSQPYSVNCEKCRQPGERIIVYCGPDQRNLNYDDQPCQLDGEHFHLYCTHCQFKWIEPLPDAV
jgi:hypothetical protein